MLVRDEEHVVKRSIRFYVHVLAFVAAWAPFSTAESGAWLVDQLVLSQAPVKITTGGTADARIPIAVPDFVAGAGQEQLGQTLAQVLAYDLDFSGEAVVLGKDAYPPAFKGLPADATNIDFAAWSKTSAEYVVHTTIKVEGSDLVAECRLLDTRSGEQVVGKRLKVNQQFARNAAHQFADIIVEHLTGIPGCATSFIAFSSGKSGKKEIYIADYDGANARELTKHGSISILPKLSPDGRKIAYLSYKDRYPFLYIMDLNTGVSRPLSKAVGLNIGPSWSPDATRLAMVMSKDANPEIYIINQDGSSPRRITNDKGIDTSPTFSPDGKRIAFVSDRAGRAQIYSMNSDGTNPVRLTRQGGTSTDPEWSPDGKMITYVVEGVEPGLQIWVMDANGENARALTSIGGTNESPCFSPDSRHIVFSSSRSGMRLETVTISTGVVQAVPGFKASGQGPSWGPRRQ
jgi:TolB protein